MKIKINIRITRIVRESDYSPTAAIFIQEQGQVLI